METTTQAGASPSKHQHKRTTSSVIKSMMPKTHQRKPSSKDAFIYAVREDQSGDMPLQNPILPPDHPISRQYLRQGSGNRNPAPASQRKSLDTQKENNKHVGDTKKMTRSTSFKASMEEKARGSKQKTEKQEVKGMKKSKSSTSLSALLSRPRSSTKGAKEEPVRRKNDKENETLYSSAEMAPPPIWAQFATQGFEEPLSTTKVPLNDRFDLEQEVALYTPRNYSPSKQRHFQGPELPTLSRRQESKPRPKSECLTSGAASASFTETASDLRRSSRDKGQGSRANQRQLASQDVVSAQKAVPNHRNLNRGSSTEYYKVGGESSHQDSTVANRGSRVMAAVAAFNGKSKELPREPTQDSPSVKLDANAIESAFEALLVSQKMRGQNCC